MDINGLHIETTNICTLKCPRCSRTEFLNKFGNKNWQNYNLNLDHLIKFLQGVDLNNKKINLCGTYGDPIYYNDLERLIKFFKNQGASITIITNGSYKTKQWWIDLISWLNINDTIVFSIDGLPTNFTEYRDNADWTSILKGIEVVTESNVTSIWKYIPFKFNENDINQAKKLSQDLGFTKFQIDPSDRWKNENDNLKPINFIGPRESSMTEYKQGKKTVSINPKCFSGLEHYITASGDYLPCCYVHDWRFYYKSYFYKNKEKFKIKNTTLLEIQKDLTYFYNDINLNKPDHCVFNCPTL